MKIGIVTLDSTNYGNRLQNYALQKFITELGENIDVYTFHRNHSKNVFLGICKKSIYKVIKPETTIEKTIDEKFKIFNDKYIKFAPEVLYRAKSNAKLNSNYDFFIAGSDQVWNPMYSNTDAESFMDFASYDKRLSYAASIGVDNFPIESKEKYKNLISNVKEISVREKQGKIAIEKLTNKKCRVDVDPTMLLDKEEWEKIETEPCWYNGEKFVLTYFLGDMSSSAKTMIEKMTAGSEIKVINMFDPEQGLEYIHTPSEFIWLIHNAEKIFTDSFHGSVFSLIFGKDFCAFERMGNETDTGSRIKTLLEMFNLYNKTNNYIQVENYDKNRINEIIQENRNNSEEYLRKVLHIK